MPQDPFASIATPVSKDDPFASIAADTPPPAKKTSGELKQSLSEKLTQGYDPGAVEFDDKHPIVGKGVRVLSSIGGMVLGLPSSVYHAAADPESEEESKKYGKGFEKKIGPTGRLIDRMVVQPVVNAAEFYAPAFGIGSEEDKKKLNQTNIKGVLPEALGVGAGSYIVGKGQEEALSKVGQLRKSTAKSQPGAVQRFARKFTQVEPAVREAVTKAADKQGEALTEHAAQSENVAQRGELAKTVDTKSQALGKHLEKVEASVGKEANEKFNAVREKLGISEGNAGPEVAPDQLVATVRNIEENVLQGIPENIKEFRSIIGHGGEDAAISPEAFKAATGVEPLGGKPFTWDKLQSLKSRIDARLRNSRGMNGDLKRGLYQARDGVVSTMGEIAEPNGAGELWTDARNFWRQYKEDFHESTGPSGSASPVAQALDAVDPKNIRGPFLRTKTEIPQEGGGFENRGTKILRKYPQHGGTEAAALADEVVGHHQSLQDMPNKPKGFSPDKPPANPVVNVNKETRDAIAQKAKNWGSFNARDVGILTSGTVGQLLGAVFGHRGIDQAIGAATAVGTYEVGKFALSRLLNNEAVIKWLSRTPQTEIEVLNKIPGADKVRIMDGLTQIAIDQSKSGKPVTLSPQAKAFIGPKNVARVLAVSVASQPKTAGEARDRIRPYAPTTE